MSNAPPRSLPSIRYAQLPTDHEASTTRTTQHGTNNRMYNAHSITINERSEEVDIGELVAWLGAPESASDHDTARRQREADTGAWLLGHTTYRGWKEDGKCLWLNAKPGAGKTILCSTVIEDVKGEDGQLAFFYFTFADLGKQSYRSLLLSLARQIALEQPLLHSLFLRRQQPTITDLEQVLVRANEVKSLTWIAVDALDECPEDERGRLLDGLLKLATLPSIRLFLTSRDYPDIRQRLEARDVLQISAVAADVDNDIRDWVINQLSEPGHRISRLPDSSKTLIVETITEKAGGMFRWAYMVIEDIKRLKLMQPITISRALENLPRGLDGAYERLLDSIHHDIRPAAISLLKWLTYSERPLTLAELGEVLIVDVDNDTVRFADRGDVEDPIYILNGLVEVVIDPNEQSNHNSPSSWSDMEQQALDWEADDEWQALARDAVDEQAADGQVPIEREARDRMLDVEASAFEGLSDIDEDVFDELETSRFICKITRLGSQERQSYRPDTVLRLAHFSVKEYLESIRIRDSQVAEFFLVASSAHHHIMRVCLIYFSEYWKSPQKHCGLQDLQEFPLLAYTQQFWYDHSRLHEYKDVATEMGFLMRPEAIEMIRATADWWPGWHRLRLVEDRSTLLHGASSTGMIRIVRELVKSGLNVNALDYGSWTPLQVASNHGFEDIIDILLEAGAEINAVPGASGTALEAAAAFSSDQRTVEKLLSAGADVNAHCGGVRTALQAAVASGDINVVDTLLAAGADVNISGDSSGSALIAAVILDDLYMVQKLLDHGADVHLRDWTGFTALHRAASRGREQILKLLLEAGADPNTAMNDGRTTLHDACSTGGPDIVCLLLEVGVDVNSRDKHGHTALIDAVSNRFNGSDIIQRLLAAGADVNCASSDGTTALIAAAKHGRMDVFVILLANGAETDVTSMTIEPPLTSHMETVTALLDGGSGVDTWT